MAIRDWVKDKKVEMVTEVIGGFLLTPKEWVWLALSCLDQAGCPAYTSDDVEGLLERRGVLRDDPPPTEVPEQDE